MKVAFSGIVYPVVKNKASYIGLMVESDKEPESQIWILNEMTGEITVNGEFMDKMKVEDNWWWMSKIWIPPKEGYYLAITFTYIRNGATPPVPVIRLLNFHVRESMSVVERYFWWKESNLIYGKRFERFNLTDLIEPNHSTVKDFLFMVTHPRDIADKVIITIEYPLVDNEPCDYHKIQYFKGNLTLVLETDDYWQKASETIRTSVGDCEDSAILCTTAYRAYGLDEKSVYTAFGVVKLVKDGKEVVLGGHGWTYADWDGNGFRLIETTLDVPPNQYPIVPDITKPFTYKIIKYEPWILFNDKEIIEVEPGVLDQGVIYYYDGARFELKSLDKPKLLKRPRPTLDKFNAIAEAWGIPTKVHRKIAQ